jgi:plasmid stability protein
MRLNVDLDPAVHAAFKVRCAMTGISMSAQVQEWISRELQAEPRQRKLALSQLDKDRDIMRTAGGILSMIQEVENKSGDTDDGE